MPTATHTSLTSLATEHREVLLETVVRARTLDEAAAALGISSRQLRLRAYAAAHALRAALRETGPAGRGPLPHADERVP